MVISQDKGKFKKGIMRIILRLEAKYCAKCGGVAPFDGNHIQLILL